MILIKYSTLLEFTLANSLALHAHTDNIITINNDTKASTSETFSTLPDIGYNNDADQTSHSNEITVKVSTVRTTTKSPLAEEKLEATTTKQDPSVTENSMQSESRIIASSTATQTFTDRQQQQNYGVLSLRGNNSNNIYNASHEFGMSNVTYHKNAENVSYSKSVTQSTKSLLSSNINNGINFDLNSSISDIGDTKSNNINNNINNNKSNNNRINDSSCKNSTIQDNEMKNNNRNNKDKSVEYDYGYTDIQQLPQADAPQKDFDASNDFSVHSIERDDAVYFIVAVIGGAKVWSRTLARTLSDIGAFGDPLGSPLKPIYVDLPANGR